MSKQSAPLPTHRALRARRCCGMSQRWMGRSGTRHVCRWRWWLAEGRRGRGGDEGGGRQRERERERTRLEGAELTRSSGGRPASACGSTSGTLRRRPGWPAIGTPCRGMGRTLAPCRDVFSRPPTGALPSLGFASGQWSWRPGTCPRLSPWLRSHVRGWVGCGCVPQTRDLLF